MTARQVVVSLHSHHARRIYAGTKSHEFRRVGAGFTAGDVVLIYETAPVAAITGSAVVHHVVRAQPRELALLEVDPAERAHVQRYLAGARAPVALCLHDVCRLAEPHVLSDVGLKRAPQSYQFLGA